jgi:predicted aldo/keto reductase-like oxidoreductase
MNDYAIFKNLARAKEKYSFETKFTAKASACSACGQCETACPQKISVISELAKGAELLENAG